MKFNFGEVLGSAAKIIWKHKIIWVPGILFSLITFLPSPIMMFFQSRFMVYLESEFVDSPDPIIFSTIILFALASFFVMIPVTVLGLSMPSQGTLMIEQGEKVSLGGMFEGVLKKFWRLLGSMLLIWGALYVIIFALMGCMTGFGAITMGLGMLCIFPFFLLLIPLMMAVYAVFELSWSAVLTDDLKVTNSISLAWDIVKKNLGPLALMSILLYILLAASSYLLMIPMMAPMYGMMFQMSASQSPDMTIYTMQNIFSNMALWSLAVAPVYALVEGVIYAFMQSVWMLIYLRVTEKKMNSPAEPVYNA